MSESPICEKNGIILIDKPAGMSSAGVVSRVKKITGAKKVGHTGTLDPFATGLMICGINSGTRLSRFFLKGDKSYEAGLLLGVDTDTMDCTGKSIKICDEDFFNSAKIRRDRAFFEALLKAFEGTQQQMPPVYSALKHKGVPLYKLARKGMPVQKPPRTVTIYSICLKEMTIPSLVFEVSCSSGTYIRTLASDIGAKLGSGGHLFSLRRTRSCGFTIDDAISLDQLADSSDPSGFFLSMDDALPDMFRHIADEGLEVKISNGVGINEHDGIKIPEGLVEDAFIKVLNKKNQMIAVLNYIKSEDKYNYCCVFHN